MDQVAHKASVCIALTFSLVMASAAPAFAQSNLLESARRQLDAANPKSAYNELIRLEPQLAGNSDYDLLLGIAAFESGKFSDAIMAFERVLTRNPNHAGALMDLARAYFAVGDYGLARKAFVQLADSNPPPLARQAINRYLEEIRSRLRLTAKGWHGYAELGLGYDTNITGVPSDFGEAALQSFGIFGIEATGNSIKRKAGLASAAGLVEYSHPLQGGWSVVAGGEARLRGFEGEAKFNSAFGEARAGAALNEGPSQWSAFVGYAAFNQEGDAPGEPKPTNDRRTAHAQGQWRYNLDSKTQVALGVRLASVRFPANEIEDFNQVYLSASWLRSFEGQGVPQVNVAIFASDDKAVNKLADGHTDKSKRIAGVRSYAQYSLTPMLDFFGGLDFAHWRDRDDFARSTVVAKGRDKLAGAFVGLAWQFKTGCAVRSQLFLTRNDSSIALYDYNRGEVSTAVRCEFN